MTVREKTLWLIKNRPVDIARGFGWTKLYKVEENTLHNDWLKMIIFAMDDDLIQGNRKSYKTTCVIAAIAIKMIFMPTVTQAFLRKTDDDVKEVVNGVRKCLESDTAIALAYNLWGVELELDRQNAFQLSTNLYKSARGSSQLTGMGIGGSLVGKHFDILYTDDIVTDKDKAFRSDRETTKRVYRELGNILNDKDPDNPYTGVIINTGTPWHINDAYTLMPPPHKYIADPAMITKYKPEEISGILKKLVGLKITGLPSRDTFKKQERILTKSEFFSNYFMTHVSNETQIYSEPKFTTDKKRIMGGFAHLDCAYGGDNFTALTLMNKDFITDNYFAYGIVRNRHVKECYHEIIRLYKEFNINTLFLEDNADKGYVEDELQRLHIYTKGYHESTNKHVKIQTHLYNNWDNILWFNETDPQYMIQIADYEEGAEPDDAPDSCASLLREMSSLQKAWMI